MKVNSGNEQVVWQVIEMIDITVLVVRTILYAPDRGDAYARGNEKNIFELKKSSGNW